jgi:hypothetical protein
LIYGFGRLGIFEKSFGLYLKENIMYGQKFFLTISFTLAFGLVTSTVAQDIYWWTNAGGDGLWNRDTEPYNWERAPAWNPDGPRTPCPPPPHGSSNVWISGNPTTLAAPLVIPAEYNADCTYGEDYGTIYGPEWGLHLDIYGSLTYRWYLVLAQGLAGLTDIDNPDNDPNRSVVNMYDGSRIHGTQDSPGDPARAEGIAIGTNWWDPLPYVTMNMYEGSECLVNWVWIGGHLNLYGGTFDVLVGVNMGIGTPENVPDELISVDIYEGELILPPDFGDEIQDWIDRGILKAYGTTPGLPMGPQIDIDTDTMPGRTIVTALPQNPPEASGPNPPNGATDIRIDTGLNWRMGLYADRHDVFIGTDANDINNVNPTNLANYPNVTYQNVGINTFKPTTLEMETTYYWRIDEVNELNPDSPWTGEVWSFRTGAFLVVDDFEDYNAGDNQIWFAWHDGLGAGVPGSEPYIPGNGTGAAIGDETTSSYTEETIVNSGNQSMPYWYDNNKPGFAYYSEAEMTLSRTRDWTEDGVKELSLWFRGYSASVGSFIEAPFGTYTITSSGTDITGQSDGFHYAYKMLTGPGSITARVVSIDNTDPWAKAGVMIRETLEPGSKHALMCITPNNGAASVVRVNTGEDSYTSNQTGIAAPHWLKLERDLAGNFTVSHSLDGSSWASLEDFTSQSIQMSTNVYIGLAVTSRNPDATCQAVFSDVRITGNVSQQQWLNQDIGIQSNDPEPMYIAISNSTGTPVVVYNDDPNASVTDVWTEWVIPLPDLEAQGLVLNDVDRITLGFGTKGNITIPGGSGKMYFDDIRLYRPRNDPAE